MEGLPPLLESDYHDLSLTNGAQGLWSFSEILAARLPELKEAFLSRSASPGSNLGSFLGLGSRDPLVNNAETSMPHHPRRITAPPLFREDGPVTSFPEDAFLSLPSDRFSGSYTAFLLEENSTAAPYPISCSTMGPRVTRFTVRRRRLRPTQVMRVWFAFRPRVGLRVWN